MSELPIEGPYTAAPHALVRTALLAVAVLGLANLVGGRWIASQTPNFAYAMVDDRWRTLDQGDGPLAKGLSWIVLGDSSGAHGFRPRVFAEAGGGSSHNLCSVANALVLDDAWMLKRLLERHPAPVGVLLIHTFDVWPRRPNPKLIAQIPRAWGFWRRAEPPADLGLGQELIATIAWAAPLWAEHASIADRWLGRRAPWFAVEPDGYVPAGRGSVDRLFDADLERTVAWLADPPTPLVSDANWAALQALAAQTEAHQVSLVLTSAPVLDEVAAHPAYVAYQRRLDHLLEAWADRHEHVRRLPDPPPVPRSSLEAYVDHLRPEAAADFTRALAAYLAPSADLNAPRVDGGAAAEGLPLQALE